MIRWLSIIKIFISFPREKVGKKKEKNYVEKKRKQRKKDKQKRN